MYIAPKKSTIRVKQEALKLSQQFPDTPYYVMDKKNKRAVCHSVDWAVKEKIMNGWHIVCRYQNGQEFDR